MNERIEQIENQPLPQISSVEHPAKPTGERGRPTITIWLGDGNYAIRYAWDEERGEIREQTYDEHSLYEEYGVGGGREDLARYALETISEYLNGNWENIGDLKHDWGNVYDLIVTHKLEKNEGTRHEEGFHSDPDAWSK